MRSRRAYTFVELVMVIVIAGIVAAIFAVVITTGIDSWVFMKGQKRVMADTRSAMKRMAREIRITKSVPAGVLGFSSTEYDFRDINGSRIEYRKSGSNLLRNGLVLLQNLESSGGLEFVYLDSQGAGTTVINQIRIIQITLRVQDSSNRSRLRSAAAVRNR